MKNMKISVVCRGTLSMAARIVDAIDMYLFLDTKRTDVGCFFLIEVKVPDKSKYSEIRESLINLISKVLQYNVTTGLSNTIYVEGYVR